MRVLALAAYPELGAGTRFRMAQYRGLLAAMGITLELVTFLDDDAFRLLFSAAPSVEKAGAVARVGWRHARALAGAKRPDVIWVQREASLLGPEVVEWALERRHRAPILFDVDDAIWLRPPADGARNPRWARLLRSTAKAHRLARRAAHVLAGSSHLAEHFRRLNPKTTVVPTVPSCRSFVPAPAKRTRLRIGWMGSHSTAPFVRALLPVFDRLRGAGHDFEVQLVGGDVAGLASKPFRLHEELSDLQSFDIGVAPMPPGPWTDGKCGFKQLEYMAVGIPCVTSPWRGDVDFIRDGENALVARHEDEWFSALGRLLSDAALRARLGAAGRQLVEERMCAERQVDTIASVLRSLC